MCAKRVLDLLELELQMVSHEPQSRCWYSNPGSLEEQPFLLLVPEPSQPQIKAHKGFPIKPRPPFLGLLKALGKQPQVTLTWDELGNLCRYRPHPWDKLSLLKTTPSQCPSGTPARVKMKSHCPWFFPFYT